MTKDNKNNLFNKVLIGVSIAAIGLVGKIFYDYKKDNTSQSLQSWLLERLFRMFSYPLSQLESRTLFEKGIDAIGDKTEKHINLPQLEGIDTSEAYLKEMQILLFNDKKDDNQQVIFFLHGGAYLFQPASPHFNTLKEIIRQTDAKVVMPIYPKAPNYDFKDAYPKVLKTYIQTIHKTDSPQNVTLMGDSAGGGLALGLSSLLADENLAQPRQLILISPWLDAGSENPNMKKFEESDPILPSQIYFQATGRLWARGEDNVYHPLVSPIYTNQLDNIPPVHIIAGGDEMLYPDILRFKSYMKEEDKEVHLYVKEDMGHDYAIFNTPEGKEARQLINKIIAGKK